MNFLVLDLFFDSFRDVAMPTDCGQNLQNDLYSTLTQKISQGISVPFGTKRQKSTYHTKYLSKYWTELRQLFSFGSSYMQIIKLK